jgi:hypothetical protein
MEKRVNNFGFTLEYLPVDEIGYVSLNYILGDARIVVMGNGQFYVTGRDASIIRFDRELVAVIFKLHEILQSNKNMSNTELYLLMKREWDNVMDLITENHGYLVTSLT